MPQRWRANFQSSRHAGTNAMQIDPGNVCLCTAKSPILLARILGILDITGARSQAQAAQRSQEHHPKPTPASDFVIQNFKTNAIQTAYQVGVANSYNRSRPTGIYLTTIVRTLPRDFNCSLVNMGAESRPNSSSLGTRRSISSMGKIDLDERWGWTKTALACVM